MSALVDILCLCGGTFRRDNHGRAVCRVCKTHVSMESLLAQGLSPMWSQNTLVTHSKEQHA